VRGARPGSPICVSVATRVDRSVMVTMVTMTTMVTLITNKGSSIHPQ
jgi:hypothetical protein